MSVQPGTPLPCPFCGGQVESAQWEGHWGWSHPANGCFIQHYDPYDYDTEAEAIAAWNTRSNSFPDLIAALEAVRDFECADGDEVGAYYAVKLRARSALSALSALKARGND